MASPKSKKHSRWERKILEEFGERFTAREPFKDTVVLLAPRGKAKLSEVLVDFIGPYRDRSADSQEDFEQLITVAVIAWNIALLPAKEHKKHVDRFVAETAQGDGRALRLCVEDMIKRKRKHFHEHTRLIVDFQVTPTPDGPHLSVVSTRS